MVKRRATHVRRRGKGRRGTVRRQRGGGGYAKYLCSLKKDRIDFGDDIILETSFGKNDTQLYRIINTFKKDILRGDFTKFSEQYNIWRNNLIDSSLFNYDLRDEDDRNIVSYFVDKALFGTEKGKMQSWGQPWREKVPPILSLKSLYSWGHRTLPHGWWRPVNITSMKLLQGDLDILEQARINACIVLQSRLDEMIPPVHIYPTGKKAPETFTNTMPVPTPVSIKPSTAPMISVNAQIKAYRDNLFFFREELQKNKKIYDDLITTTHTGSALRRIPAAKLMLEGQIKEYERRIAEIEKIINKLSLNTAAVADVSTNMPAPTPAPTPIKPPTFTVSGTAGVSMKPKPSLTISTAHGANVPPISTTPTNPFNLYNVGKALPTLPSNPFNSRIPLPAPAPAPMPARPAPRPLKPFWTANAKERARTAARTKGIPVSANLIYMPNRVGNPPILPNDDWNAGSSAIPLTASMVPSAGAGAPS